MQAIITQIQRFSLGDGPGIRSTVFFKGCNLRCPWCHNPETILPTPHLMLYEGRCTHCGACARVCSRHQVSETHHAVKHDGCAACGACVAVCANDALEVCGQAQTTAQLLDVILEDIEFYRASGGGVTLSGGEPLLQPDACAELAAACKEKGISVLLDTAGNVEKGAIDRALPFMDMCYFDLKSGQPEGYQAIRGNLDRTMENLSYVSGRVETVARIPVVPGFNDSREDAEKMARLLKNTSVIRAELLPFHRMGAGKYQALGWIYAYADCEPMSYAQIDTLTDVYRAIGIDAVRGG